MTLVLKPKKKFFKERVKSFKRHYASTISFLPQNNHKMSVITSNIYTNAPCQKTEEPWLKSSQTTSPFSAGSTNKNPPILPSSQRKIIKPKMRRDAIGRSRGAFLLKLRIKLKLRVHATNLY
jgi:hypothetical protein